MGFSNLANDRQTQARSGEGPGGLDAVEPFEDHLAIRLGNPRPLVVNDHLPAIDLHPNTGPFGCELHRILDKVANRPSERHRSSLDDGLSA